MSKKPTATESNAPAPIKKEALFTYQVTIPGKGETSVKAKQIDTALEKARVALGARKSELRKATLHRVEEMKK